MESIAVREHIERVLSHLHDSRGPSVSERVRLVGLAAECILATSDLCSTEAALALFQVLAIDPRPEVRRAVAEASSCLPPEAFEHVLAPLTNDPDPSVIQAVARALIHRRRDEPASPRGTHEPGGWHRGVAQRGGQCGVASALCASVTIEQFLDCVGESGADAPESSLHILLAALERPAEKAGPAPRAVILAHLLVGASIAPPGCPLMRTLVGAIRAACEMLEHDACDQNVHACGAGIPSGEDDTAGPQPLDGRSALEAAAPLTSLPHDARMGEPEAPALRPFGGGEMVLRYDRVDLLGEPLVRSRHHAHGYRILRLLAERRGVRYVSYSGNDLAAALRIENGQGGVASCVKNLRKGAKGIFMTHGFRYRRGDVIKSGGRGYRLNGWIRVKDESGELFR